MLTFLADGRASLAAVGELRATLRSVLRTGAGATLRMPHAWKVRSGELKRSELRYREPEERNVLTPRNESRICHSGGWIKAGIRRTEPLLPRHCEPSLPRYPEPLLPRHCEPQRGEAIFSHTRIAAPAMTFKGVSPKGVGVTIPLHSLEGGGAQPCFTPHS